MSIISDIEHAPAAGERDIRKELPKLMALLGVNTESEHQVFHAALIWVVGELGKLANNPEAAADIASVL